MERMVEWLYENFAFVANEISFPGELKFCSGCLTREILLYISDIKLNFALVV